MDFILRVVWTSF